MDMAKRAKRAWSEKWDSPKREAASLLLAMKLSVNYGASMVKTDFQKPSLSPTHTAK